MMQLLLTWSFLKIFQLLSLGRLAVAAALVTLTRWLARPQPSPSIATLGRPLHQLGRPLAAPPHRLWCAQPLLGHPAQPSLLLGRLVCRPDRLPLGRPGQPAHQLGCLHLRLPGRPACPPSRLPCRRLLRWLARPPSELPSYHHRLVLPHAPAVRMSPAFDCPRSSASLPSSTSTP